MSSKNNILEAVRSFDRSHMRKCVVRVTREDGSQCEERLKRDGSGLESRKINQSALPQDKHSSGALFRQYGFIPQEKRDLQVANCGRIC